MLAVMDGPFVVQHLDSLTRSFVGQTDAALRLAQYRNETDHEMYIGGGTLFRTCDVHCFFPVPVCLRCCL